MGQIKAYISHSIRGKSEEGATNKEREINSKKACEFGALMRKEFPNIEWYIPGEHQEIDTIAYRKGYMTEEQILDIDCEIINGCNFMVVYSPDDYISKGMQIEIDHCVRTHVSIISAVDGNYDEYVKRIIHAINCYLTSCMR